MKPEIIDIAPKYNTDKNDHGYIEHYAKHLPETAKKILEIGVLGGNSIRLWRELYPEADIYGLDLFIENPIPFQADWAYWVTGSQTDGKILNSIRHYGPFDFIIDDGSHNHRDQLMTFFGLWGCTKLYVVEDIYQDEFWSQGLPLSDNIGSLNVGKVFNYDKIKFFYG